MIVLIRSSAEFQYMQIFLNVIKTGNLARLTSFFLNMNIFLLTNLLSISTQYPLEGCILFDQIGLD